MQHNELYKERNAVKYSKNEKSRENCDFFVLFTYMYLYRDLNTQKGAMHLEFHEWGWRESGAGAQAARAETGKF
ncbi:MULTISPECIES: hypothetical protein [unclassified Paenibacillus]|uniref:hypothetical protein n=1 Tax=unclassified Paenibacillus TaxID=185978 RepID=UPI0024056950|nr:MULTISPECIES: hypothetical protein [unclassified Paenibacillus]MDF9842579.1 hypothetical protein [Paenibacillus sp. PastF-2]MDF9849214.1 hypothetical protein [Paenibacillus sp. PastM-2]MDF9855739.1 hypothetical protein [Paenibacillus sp. PastF-1]